MIRVHRRWALWCGGVVLQCLTAAATVLPAGAAHKAGPAPRAGAVYAACMAKANSTSDMRACQTAGLAEANARLRVAYAKALAALPADQQAKLRKAEAQWAAFRLSDCQVFYGNETGTIATVQGGACMIERTEDRIKNLRGFSLQ